MTTTRSYREAMLIAAAVAEMRRCAGAQFDPRVVEALLECVGLSARSGAADDPPSALAA
jgi:HD-GYP domain-containing protein (c-di-GMP phosphodiesterase class II)